MANPEHLAKLEEGVEAWNKWREENRALIPDLENANLKYAQLNGANLIEAHLVRANLLGVQLEGADFTHAQLEKTNLSHARLKGAYLISVNLKGADLFKAQLDDSNLSASNLEGANLEKVQLNRAELEETELKDASLAEAILENANLYKANLEGADLSDAQLERADLSNARFQRADLYRADFSNANLNDCTGLRFNDTKVLHARLTARPGNSFNRLLNPFFIYNPKTDPWSELRRAYTGPNFLLTLLALIGFLLPYIFQIATWRSINIAQELAQENLIRLQTEYDELVTEGVITLSVATTLESTIEKLKNVDTCLAEECKSYRIWQLLIGVNKGWRFVALALAIILYNILRHNLTQTILAFREEEERSGYTPALKEYFTPSFFGVFPDSDKASPTMRKLASIIGLSPTRLHVVLRILFLVATVAFFVNLFEVLFTVVKLRA